MYKMEIYDNQITERMKIQSQEPIIFVPLNSFTNEDSRNFTLLKSDRWQFYYSFIDSINYLHMSHNEKICEE